MCCLQRISFLETENEKLKKSLKDCEKALDMANNETTKSNEVARDAKAKIAKQERTIQELKKDLERKLKEAHEKYTAAEEKVKSLQDELRDLQVTNAKFEKDLIGVHAGLQDREMRIEDKHTELAAKDAAIENKERMVEELSDKVII